MPPTTIAGAQNYHYLQATKGCFAFAFRTKIVMSEVSVCVSLSGQNNDLWQICIDHLAQELPEQQFNTWIRPLIVVVAADLSKATVQVGNRFKLDWVRAQYAARIAALLEKASGQRIPIELVLAPREAPSKSEPLTRKFEGASGVSELAVTTAVHEEAAG